VLGVEAEKTEKENPNMKTSKWKKRGKGGRRLALKLPGYHGNLQERRKALEEGSTKVLASLIKG